MAFTRYISPIPSSQPTDDEKQLLRALERHDIHPYKGSPASCQDICTVRLTTEDVRALTHLIRKAENR